MQSELEYELVDFGYGRKLESLSGYLIDRPSPAASLAAPMRPELWSQVGARFHESARRWEMLEPWPKCSLSAGGFKLPFHPTPFGHIGVFPEQRENWIWLCQRVSHVTACLRSQGVERQVHALNLFAHTGGSTLAMAAAGAQVAHVDAAKPNVAAAKQAAVLSQLEAAPIRYLVDDAAKFSQRELRRQRQYDIIVLDPPAYGHGPDGKTWRIQRDLMPLLDVLVQLCQGRQGALLITGHTEGMTSQSIIDYLKPSLTTEGVTPQCVGGRSCLIDRSGRKLDTGFFVQVSW